jgi:hypothetical protein
MWTTSLNQVPHPTAISGDPADAWTAPKSKAARPYNHRTLPLTPTTRPMRPSSILISAAIGMSVIVHAPVDAQAQSASTTLAVGVQYQGGQPLEPLKPGDLQVAIKGKPRAVTALSPAGKASVLLMLDLSGSMTGAFPVDGFMSSVAGLATFVHGAERVRFIALGDKVDAGPDLDLDAPQTIQFIKSREYQNQTRLYDAIDMAITDLERRSAPRAIVVISDGSDTASKINFSKLSAHGRLADIRFFSIGPPPLSVRPGMPKSFGDIKPDRLFIQLAKDSGGDFFPLKDPGQLDEAFTAIVAMLRTELVATVDVSGLKPGLYDVQVRNTRPDLVLRLPRNIVVR